MDVFEHAYMIDYGKDRVPYLDAFMKNLDWKEIEARFR
jgi:Fe-Mn family superoxide dismutase